LWGVNDATRDNSDIRQNYRLNSYALLTAPWIKGLTYRINFQNNLYTQQTGDFFHESYYVGEGAVTNTQRYAPATIQNYLTSANGSMIENSTYSYVLDNILNYNQRFNKHNLDITAVATSDDSKYRYKNMTGTNYAANGNTSLSYWGLHLATTPKVNLDANDRANIGYLARLNYNFDNRYFLTGSFRRDGASVFGENQKWGNFGAAGVAWRITEEKFMKSFKALSNLKLKLSWGQNGNQGVGPYSTLARVTNGLSSGVRYEFSNTGSQINYGLIQSNLANSNLGWESTEKWNAGFESAWLDNRIFVDLDFYASKTTNEIYTPTIPSMTGFSVITSSLGEVHNKGFELTLRTINIQTRNFNWNTSITYWLNRNKLIHIDGQDLNKDGVEDDKIADNMFIGKPLNAIYGYVQDGIVQPSDVAYKAMPGAATIDGYPKYKDINNDKQINADDRKILGYSQENFRLNMSNSFTYKNLELYVMVTGIFGGGNYYMRSNPMAYMSTTGDGFNTNMTYRPFWTVDNLTNTYPAAFFKGDGGKFLGLQSRSFVRVQNISLSYNINRDWLEQHKLNTIKVFCTATNPFISTKWVGGDPEIGTTLLSTDPPVPSTYSFGVNVNF
jgi:TonB-linked SusC/RagA family outer membrane protein